MIYWCIAMFWLFLCYDSIVSCCVCSIAIQLLSVKLNANFQGA